MSIQCPYVLHIPSHWHYVVKDHRPLNYSHLFYLFIFSFSSGIRGISVQCDTVIIYIHARHVRGACNQLSTKRKREKRKEKSHILYEYTYVWNSREYAKSMRRRERESLIRRFRNYIASKKIRSHLQLLSSPLLLIIIICPHLVVVVVVFDRRWRRGGGRFFRADARRRDATLATISPRAIVENTSGSSSVYLYLCISLARSALTILASLSTTTPVSASLSFFLLLNTGVQHRSRTPPEALLLLLLLLLSSSTRARQYPAPIPIARDLCRISPTSLGARRIAPPGKGGMRQSSGLEINLTQPPHGVVNRPANYQSTRTRVSSDLSHSLSHSSTLFPHV